MYKKSCPYCNKDSYSAASTGSWECPYCHADLTIFIPLPAGPVTPGRVVRGCNDINSVFDTDKSANRVRGKLVRLSAFKDRLGARKKSAGRRRLPVK